MSLAAEELREFARLWGDPSATITGREGVGVLRLLHEIDDNATLVMCNLATALAATMDERDWLSKQHAKVEELVARVIGKPTWSGHGSDAATIVSAHWDRLRERVEELEMRLGLAQLAIRDCTSPRGRGHYECRFGVVSDQVQTTVREAWEEH